MDRESLMQEQEVGYVTHYWSHLGVAGVHLTGPLDVGDHIHVLGHTSDFEMDVTSMELEHVQVGHADSGAEIGIQVPDHAREHDKVFKRVAASELGEDQNQL
jgi:putative protease